MSISYFDISDSISPNNSSATFKLEKVDVSYLFLNGSYMSSHEYFDCSSMSFDKEMIPSFSIMTLT